jgi:hypothetical protein
MAAYVETIDDWHKKYHQTIVLYDGKLVWIQNFGHFDDGLRAHLTYESAKKIERAIDVAKIQPISFDATFINNCTPAELHNAQQPLVLCQRNPRRQWKRGLCSDNVTLSDPMKPLFELYGKKCAPVPLTLSLVAQLLNPQFPTLEQAFQHIGQVWSLALSPFLAMSISNISATKHLLMSHFGFIGEIDSHGIWIHHPPMFQEVADWLKRTHQSIPLELVDAV